MHVTEGGDLTSLHWLQDLSVVRLLPDPEGSSRSKGSKSGGLLRDQDAPPNIDYRKSTAKPPHSYATLICMAISANGNKITLARIYAWIRENFLYYRTAHPSWQNSIRHNLSLNKCFVKVPRKEGEKGKGGFWSIDIDRLEQGRRSRRRRLKPSSTNGKNICMGKTTSTMALPKTTIPTNVTVTKSNPATNLNSTSTTPQVPPSLNPPLPTPGPSTNSPTSLPDLVSESVIVEPLLLAEDDLATLFLVERWDEELLNSLLDSL